METPADHMASKGNPKLGIKTGVQKPKPLKSSTETRLQCQSKQGIAEGKESLEKYYNPVKNGSTDSSREIPNVEDVLRLFMRVIKHLSDKSFKLELVRAIINLNAALKMFGEEIEAMDKDRMDKYQVTLREACKNSELDLVARLQLLEIIEMRSVKWKPNVDVSNYYRHKLQQIEQSNASEVLESGTSHLQERVNESLKSLAPICLNANAPDFIPPKQSSNSTTHQKMRPDIKVEVGAHHRRVQIIKPEVTSNNPGKNSISDRISQTKSPNPPPSPSGDGYVCNRLSGDYAYTVPVGNGNYVNIQGNDPELTKAANLILRDFFHGKSKRTENGGNQNGNKPITEIGQRKEKIVGKDINLIYDRATLMTYAECPLSKQLPSKWSVEWEKVKAKNPSLYHQVVYEELKQTHARINAFKPKFPNFVRSNDEEEVSTVQNGKVLSESYISRGRTVGGRKYDSNNNNYQNEKSFRSKSKTWDEATEQWVEVDHMR